VTDYLSRNCPGSVDFDAHIAHLEWRPVLVLDQIPEQPGSSLAVILVFGIGYTSNLGNSMLGVIGDPDKPAIRRVGRSHQWFWLG